MSEEKCTLCCRSGDPKYFEKHHLTPGKHRRTKVNRQNDVTIVCVDCGDQIHLMFDNRELRDDLDSVEALQVAMEPFIKWVQKRPLDRKVTMKRKKRKL